MSSKIKILSENLCNQIAAGEVVERPLSVVKELVENSLDARATEIRIIVEKGGKRLIRVEDNGVGMSREDLFLCLERHATSKIATADDLFCLETLGFRGEALPSIAAVSRMRLASQQEESAEGFEIHMDAGKVQKASAAGIPAGTVIEVRNLFFNTPARKKFLKTEQTEFSHIADFISKIALSFPQVQISLEHNHRTVINLFRHHSLSDRVVALLGTEMFSHLISFEKSGAEGLKVHGFLGAPDVHRNSASAVHSFVNRRFVRDRLFQHAVMEGYRNLLPRHRYPVVILFLEIPPDLVDVNVHPAKREVRFRQQGIVHDFIADSIQDALRGRKLSAGDSKPAGMGWSLPVSENQKPENVESRKPYPSVSTKTSRSYPGRVVEELKAFKPVQSPGPSQTSDPEAGKGEEISSLLPADPDFQKRGFFSTLQVIGQYHNSYIICQSRDDLILIDQHAAHERIGFERLKSQLKNGRVEIQELLFPKAMEFGFQDAAALQENLEQLLKFGFGLEPYGGKAFVLRSIPAVLNPDQAEQVLKETLEEIVALGKSRAITHEIERLLITMACHSMVRANQPLSLTEMKSLLQEMDDVDFSTHCPHGRPAVMRLSLHDVEKMFHRP
jgi:DNA mismatch repair protein MutL